MLTAFSAISHGNGITKIFYPDFINGDVPGVTLVLDIFHDHRFRLSADANKLYPGKYSGLTCRIDLKTLPFIFRLQRYNLCNMLLISALLDLPALGHGFSTTGHCICFAKRDRTSSSVKANGRITVNSPPKKGWYGIMVLISPA